MIRRVITVWCVIMSLLHVTMHLRPFVTTTHEDKSC